jgi:hypothetical protein
MEPQRERMLGPSIIAGFYGVGVLALIAAMFFNGDQVGIQVANIHGLPALAGFPIMILTCIVGTVVGIGLYNMTRWGYWLTLAYMVYLLVVPTILVGRDASLFANLTWPLTVATYLVLKRRQYFGIYQRA